MTNQFENLVSLLGDDVSVRWLITLLHFVWQGAVVGGVVAIAGRFLRDVSARSRYALYSAALLSLPFCVAVTFCVIDRPASWQSSAQLESSAGISHDSSTLPSQVTAITSTIQMETAEATDAPVLSERVAGNVAMTNAVADDNSESLSRFSLAILSRAALWIAVAYVVGVACFLLRLSTALWGGHRLRTRAVRVTDAKLLKLIVDQADRVKLKCVPAVAYCQRVTVPTVVGVLRPMILLPVPLMTGLTSDDFVAIILHELAHIRRCDLWMKLLQRIIESLLFFHPVVWFLSRRLSAEREVCCDDLVVSSGYEPTHYAGALLRMAELCAISRQPGALALSAFGDKTPLLERRIERLMNWGNTPPLRLTRAGMAALLMTLSSLIVLPGIAHTWAQALAAVDAPPPKARGADDLVPIIDVEDNSDPELLASRNATQSSNESAMEEGRNSAEVRPSARANVQVDLLGNSDGSLKTIRFAGEDLGSGDKAFESLSRRITEWAGAPDRPKVSDREVEILADHNLHHEVITRAISVLTGKMNPQTGKVERQIGKVKLAPPKDRGELTISVGFTRDKNGNKLSRRPIVFWSDQIMRIDDVEQYLRSWLKQQSLPAKDISLILRADSDVGAGSMQALIKQAQSAGFQRFTLRQIQPVE